MRFALLVAAATFLTLAGPAPAFDRSTVREILFRASQDADPEVRKAAALLQERGILAPGGRASATEVPAPVPDDVSVTRMVEGVPDVMQMDESSCGVGCVQAVAMRLGHWGYQREWAESLGTTLESGTPPDGIVKGFLDIGVSAEVVEGMTLEALKDHLDAGRAVILDIQAWHGEPGYDYASEWEDGHYVVAVGYNDDLVFLEDPSLLGTLGYVTQAELAVRWRDYEVIDGKRREYVRSAIVVHGKPVFQPRFTHVD